MPKGRILIEETRENARTIFEQWFPVFGKGDEPENRERLFEYFHSGYLAGTRHGNLTGERRGGTDSQSLAIDDINRNIDI